MSRAALSLEARCQIILAGDAIEWCIEDRARRIANERSSSEVTSEDVEQATQDFLRENLSELPDLIARVKADYRRRSHKAA